MTTALLGMTWAGVTAQEPRVRVAVSHESQPHTPPVGWTFERGLPASSASAPPDWTARVVTTEESDLVEIAWSSDGGPSGDIAPGATMTGFSVTLPRPSAEYTSAGFMVILGNGTRISGRVGPSP